MSSKKTINLKEIYEKYLRLNYIQSRNDPEEAPFESKYKARIILESQIKELTSNDSDLIDDDSSQFMSCLDLRHLNATYQHFLNMLDTNCLSKHSMNARKFVAIKLFEFNLAKNYMETEEIESSEKILAKLVLQLEELTLNTSLEQVYNPLLFNLKLNCFLELIIVWSSRADYKKCIKLLAELDEAYAIYKQYSLRSYLNDEEFQTEGFTSMPFDLVELIGIDMQLTNEERKTSFESIYTHSLFYSAQIYGKLDDKEKSAYYCQLTLQRQIDEHSSQLLVKSTDTQTNLSETSEKKSLASLNKELQEKISFNPLDWATHAAALSQFYVCKNDFATARHCLCSADSILNMLNAEQSTKSEPNSTLSEQTHSIRRCWGKYAIEILKSSKTRLLESTDMPDQKLLLQQLDLPSKFHFNLPAKYDLDECVKTSISSNIPLDYEQARVVFLKAISILNSARDFFVLDGYVTDHCEITRDISELYSCLIFFEPDLERRCKMHKRRLDLLLPICSEISEQFYLIIMRQLLFDIGSIYSEMMDAKLEIFSEKKEKNLLTPAESKGSIQKINQLATKGIQIFESFLNTMKVMPKKEVLPEKFDDHTVRPALLAKFYLGRFYSKLICLEPAQRLENMRKTLENYSYLVEYCDKHKNDNSAEAIEQMINEYTVCKEMIAFLPAKMEKIRLQVI